ncbi:hypothetical protein Clacol_005465 [Clathrus columnatus]|uniref:Uncharacterized protein n=1 Tax=Clathrus columnatus TaxID=1419009 RepID=A0AAV5AF05_9AGAM|nr:hypothetical protein Clacol_005465 [Clathrus columnatus]
MKSGTFAVALVRQQVVLVQLARNYTSYERTIDVLPYQHFGARTFLSDPTSPRTRISSADLLTILPVDDTELCSITGMLDLPEEAYIRYAEDISRFQRRLSHVWSAIPFRVSLR